MEDGSIDDADHTFWVKNVAGTLFGDANLDKQIEFADFLSLSAHFSKTAGWAHGDFDGNGVTEFADFLRLSTNFGKSRADMVNVAVPEPGASIMVLLSSVTVLLFLRRRNQQASRSKGNNEDSA